MSLVQALAYTPFVDALSIHEQWYLLIIPMSILLAIGYKAIRCSNMKKYPREVFVFTVQILGGLLLLAIVFTLVVTVVIPMVAPMPS